MKNRTANERFTTGSFDPGKAHRRRMAKALPSHLDLRPVGRWPTRLSEETQKTVLNRPFPASVATACAEFDRSGRQDASIVVPTCNNLVFSRMCLETVLVNTRDLNFEMVVVDNGSSDGSREFLTELARRDFRVRLVLNDRNLGFAAAINRGLRTARGRNLVLLNNDTLVPPGALTALLQHLKDPELGLVGPMTNRASNEARVPVNYRTYDEMLRFASRFSRKHRPRVFDIRTPFMFCVAFRRDLYERIGALDERYGIGLFEDEDYATRVRRQGYRLVCAEDAFVHHFGEASTGNLTENGGYGALFHANRRRFEKKWSEKWTPHRRRRTWEYQRSVSEFRRSVNLSIPPTAEVLVVSRGDGELLRLGSRSARHFPSSDDGIYLGYHPATSSEAIGLLERMRQRGAEFLAFPATALWWLEHYRDFDRHMRRNYPVRHEDSSCLIFSVRKIKDGRGGPKRSQIRNGRTPVIAARETGKRAP